MDKCKPMVEYCILSLFDDLSLFNDLYKFLCYISTFYQWKLHLSLLLINRYIFNFFCQ